MGNSSNRSFIFNYQVVWVFLGLLLIFSNPAQAQTNLDCYKMSAKCKGKAGYSSPSASGQIKINPSAVPTEKGIGIEGIFFDDEIDFGLVRGTGRVGAAISPSNSEETFFGPPGFEVPEDFLIRKKNKKKYPNQKVTLATAFNVTERTGSGLKNYSLKAGLMARYNKFTSNVSPGAGLSGSLGALNFGGSIYSDESQLNYGVYGSELRPVVKYHVQTFNVGLFLNSVVFDYSNLRLHATDPSTVQLLTVSLMLKKFILTASKRSEDSSRSAYNYESKQLEVLETKEEIFGGIQYSAHKNLMIGALYNYYLLREISATATLFF